MRLTSFELHFFLSLFNFFQDPNLCAPDQLLRIRIRTSTNDVVRRGRLSQVHGAPCKAVIAEESINVGEHAKKAIFVEESPYYLTVARRIVQNIPKAVLQADHGLL